MQHQQHHRRAMNQNRLGMRKMKNIITWVPFLGALTINMCIIFAFGITGSLGMIALLIPGALALVLTHQIIKEND
tara:strand:- start:698 stop:922 length:225 start_codon:yes stop_codon:yes gene_type:complete